MKSPKYILTREELIQKLQEIKFWDDVLPDLDFYLNNFINSKDLEVIKLLLDNGANPNPIDDEECYFMKLLYEYRDNKTLKGDLILRIMEALLKAGANPNKIWYNNYRAYDYAVMWNLEPIANLFEKHGIDKKLREYI